MRVFIAVLVLIFGFQSWTKAEDIRDFQIEGMSIGDSLLDYFSESEIKKKKFYRKQAKTNKKYAFFNIKNVKNYDKSNVAFRDSDNKFKIIFILFNNETYKNK